jgi:8-oxo-dGTP diphosphatase
MVLNAETHKWESDYWHPAVTVDAVVFGYDEEEGGLSVLLIERGEEPFKGSWALPGGFITQTDESVEAAVRRELQEETNVEGIYLKEFKTFSKIDRDPRPDERVITIAFLALVVKDSFQIKGGDDAKNAQWFSIGRLPELAFDHQEIIEVAFERLQQIVHFEPIVFHLLNKDSFTMPQLHHIYKAILMPPEGSNVANDRRNFMKKMLALGYVEKTGETVRGRSNRPPELYRFDEEKYWEVKNAHKGVLVG